MHQFTPHRGGDLGLDDLPHGFVTLRLGVFAEKFVGLGAITTTELFGYFLELHRRCADVDPRISISTVYRTVNLFEEAGIIERHDFREGRARYETMRENHHDHLINLRTGEVIEFQSEEIERLQAEIARKLGFKLVDHRLDLYAVPLDDKAKS